MNVSTLPEKIFLFICGFGILQGILLAALIYFHPKSDRSVNLYFALFIFSCSVIISLPLIVKSVGWQNSYFVQPFPLLPGPFLYLYLKSFREKISWRSALPHFLPFLLFFFLIYWNLSYYSGKYPQSENVPGEVLRAPTTMILIYARPLQQLLYYLLSRRTLLSYQRSILHLFSETSRIDLRWARFLINGWLILIVSFLVLFPLVLIFPAYFSVLLLGNMAIATPYIYLVSYKGILQPTIWQVQPGINKEIVEVEMHEVEEIHAEKIIQEKVKMVKAAINPDKIDEIVRRITDLMELDKLYQETELTLQQLALKLQVPTYQVSLALNDGMKKNFYDVINGYRVNEAKRLLLDDKNRNFTILSVGFEAGFNSKTTFNTVFKKFTGLTPTEFRDKQKLAMTA